MSDKDVRQRLLRIHPPDEIGPERRAWAVVRRAFEEHTPAPRRPQVVKPLLAFAIALALVAAVVNPPVLDAIRDAIGREKKVTVYQQALFKLPSRGRLLVNSSQGPWIVKRRGQRRLLGRYKEASWSPHGRFVVALGRHEVVALEPNGRRRWALARPGRLAFPRWSPEIAGSTEIAYLQGRSLRVVAGDGTGDHLVDASVRRVAPAWRPGTFTLAYVDAGANVRLVDPDSRRTIWRVPAAKAVQLAWSADGTRLLVVAQRAVYVYRGADGRRVGAAGLPARAVGAEFQPGTHRIAIVIRYPQQSAVVLRNGDDLTLKPKVVFLADGRFTGAAWSPNARWLSVGWPSADALMFVTPKNAQKVVSGIRRQLGPLAAVAQGGWCCAPSS